MSILPIALLSLLLHVAIAVRLLPAGSGLPAAQAALALLLVATAVAMPLGLLARRRIASPRLATVLTWADCSASASSRRCWC